MSFNLLTTVAYASCLIRCHLLISSCVMFYLLSNGTIRRVCRWWLLTNFMIDNNASSLYQFWMDGWLDANHPFPLRTFLFRLPCKKGFSKRSYSVPTLQILSRTDDAFILPVMNLPSSWTFVGRHSLADEADGLCLCHSIDRRFMNGVSLYLLTFSAVGGTVKRVYVIGHCHCNSMHAMVSFTSLWAI